MEPVASMDFSDNSAPAPSRATAADYHGIPLGDSQPNPQAWRRGAAGDAPVRKLRLGQVDERVRTDDSNYCVDELCACDVHDCEGPIPPQFRRVTWDPETNRPIGVSPARWDDFVRRFGIPARRAALPEYLFRPDDDDSDAARKVRFNEDDHSPQPSSTTAFDQQQQPGQQQVHQQQQAQQLSQQAQQQVQQSSQPSPPWYSEGQQVRPVEYDANGVPVGADPAAWRVFLSRHGVPTSSSELPAWLFYKPTPERRDFGTEHRTEYSPKWIPPSGPKTAYGPDGVPVGVDPRVWREYLAKHGAPPDGPLPAYLFHQATPESRDFTTEHRKEFTPKAAAHDGRRRTQYGPDGVPVGVDPAVWRDYVARHGVPGDGEELPAFLFYKARADTRDFATENRRAFTPKDASAYAGAHQLVYGPDGVPVGVDPAAWRAYVAEHGLPSDGSTIPASLYYKATPDCRDFSTENRKEFTPKAAAPTASAVTYGPDGVPLGVDPAAWREYVAKYGLPSDGQLPAWLFHKRTADLRDFATENRREFTPKPLESAGRKIVYGPDGVPVGVDPRAWREYLAQHGGPPADGQLPAYLFYRSAPEQRDFTTEQRTKFTPKAPEAPNRALVYGPDGVPEGVDPRAWREYVAKHGVPSLDTVIPAYLYHKSTPESRDFATEHRTRFTPKEPPPQGKSVALGPDGVPVGVDPESWRRYVAQHGVPSDLSTLPAWLFHASTPELRDFSTEQRSRFTPKSVEPTRPSLSVGPDGVPVGVDPVAWREYIAKNGVPSDLSQLPAYLFYHAVPDRRDFTTEHRREFTPKQAAADFNNNGNAYRSDGVPLGVSAEAWREYLAQHGLDGSVPASLFKAGPPAGADPHQPPVRLIYGADGVPVGVNAAAWRDYVNSKGLPLDNLIPAYLIVDWPAYQTAVAKAPPQTPTTPQTPPAAPRATAAAADSLDGKMISLKDVPWGVDGLPRGVNPKLWRNYCRQHGRPDVKDSVPAYLFSNRQSDLKEDQRVPPPDAPIVRDGCPVDELPPYPPPKWPREHTFWDPVKKQWY